MCVLYLFMTLIRNFFPFFKYLTSYARAACCYFMRKNGRTDGRSEFNGRPTDMLLQILHLVN
jgi:hypothetical protein